MSRDGFLLRYRTDGTDGDGLSGTEGAFLACSFWLVDALHAVGRRDEAEQLFERPLSLRSDVGMLAEEYDPHTARQLGITPQTFSLVDLVNFARLRNSTCDAPEAWRSNPVAVHGRGLHTAFWCSGAALGGVGQERRAVS